MKLKNDEPRKNLYTGQWKFEAESGQTWTFYFRLGRLIWCEQTNQKTDPLFRYLAHYCPEIQKNIDKIEIDFTQSNRDLIIALYQRQLINKDLLYKILIGIVQEFLFDIIQCSQTEPISETKPSKEIPSLLPPLTKIDSILKTAENSWQDWENAGLADYSPNFYPIIQDKRAVKQELISILDGFHTLRELAWQTNQTLLNLTSELAPLIESGAVLLSQLPKTKEDNQAISRELNSVYTLPEKTIHLDITVKQFRGSSYLQESPTYRASIEQARELLEQGNVVQLIIHFQSQKTITSSLTNEFLNQLMSVFEDCAEVKRMSEFAEGQTIMELLPQRRQATAESSPSLKSTDPDSFVEPKIDLAVIVTRFRGNFSLQESPNFQTSINQAQTWLKRGNVVQLIVHFQSQKTIDMTVANQLLNRLIQRFKDRVEVKPISALKNNQMVLRVFPKQ